MTEKRELDISGSIEGIRASNWEKLELLYHDHARATGFSVQKSTLRKIDGVIHEQYFVCSKQGSTEIKENERINSQRKLVLTKRCGCDARIGIKLDIYNGDIFVKQHVVSHNHTLTRVE